MHGELVRLKIRIAFADNLIFTIERSLLRACYFTEVAIEKLFTSQKYPSRSFVLLEFFCEKQF